MTTYNTPRVPVAQKTKDVRAAPNVRGGKAGNAGRTAAGAGRARPAKTGAGKKATVTVGKKPILVFLVLDWRRNLAYNRAV
jgi:hypothetical protein